MRRHALPKLLVAAALASALTACDSKKTGSGEAPATVPVTVTTLSAVTPARSSGRMGLAQPYREETIGFEVSGRVLSVVDVGTELDGPVEDMEGAIINKGGVIARLDPSRYTQKVASLKLRIAAENAQLRAAVIEVEGSATAQANLAKLNYDRQVRLMRSGTTSQEVLDTAKANLDVANATLELKKAQTLAQSARIKELEEDLRSANLDLEDCVLRAPFGGRVTQQHVSRGAFAQPGSGVVTLTLIDPIQITLTLSADDERRLVMGSTAQIFPRGAPEGQELRGRIKSKGQVADPRTRAFLVEIMTRNQRYTVESPLSSFEKLVPIMSRYQGEEGPLYAALDAIVREGGKAHLLVVPREQVLGRKTTGSLTAHKVPVTLGTDYYTILDWHLQEVRGEGLRNQDLVVRRPTPADYTAVDTTMYQWLIRPGDLIPVSLNLGNLPRGLYVPVTAIKELNGETWVFVVEGGKAKRIAVTAHESFEDQRRVEGEGLAEGAQLVIKGVHYLADGSLVSVQGGGA